MMKDIKFNERLKGIAIGVVSTMIIMTATPALARIARETITVDFNNIRVAVNGQVVQTPYEPFIFQGRTYLPMRDVADAMGFDVTWEGITNTVHITARTGLGVTPDYPPHQTQPGQVGPGQ